MIMSVLGAAALLVARSRPLDSENLPRVLVGRCPGYSDSAAIAVSHL